MLTDKETITSYTINGQTPQAL